MSINSLADILAARATSSSTYSNREARGQAANPSYVKEKPTPYSNANLKSKARIYAVVCEFLATKLGSHTWKVFVKYPKTSKSQPQLIIVQICSPNNSLIASLTLNKLGLAQQIKKVLLGKDLIDSDSEVFLQLSLG
jgi:hypothetical protein